MDIYNKFKDNPQFTMYEVYHWEAHPTDTLNDNHQYIHPDPTGNIDAEWWRSQPFKKPNGVTHRIIHHECYKEAYPDVTIPGLVDDGPDGNNVPLSTGCVVSSKFRAMYTSIYVVDLNGDFAYKSNWPPGPGGNVETAKIWVDSTYKGLESILDDIVPVVSIKNSTVQFNKHVTIKNTGFVNITLPSDMGYTLEIFNMNGKQITTRNGCGSDSFTLSDKLAAGMYMARLSTGKGVYLAPIVIKN